MSPPRCARAQHAPPTPAHACGAGSRASQSTMFAQRRRRSSSSPGPPRAQRQGTGWEAFRVSLPCLALRCTARWHRRGETERVVRRAALGAEHAREANHRGALAGRECAKPPV